MSVSNICLEGPCHHEFAHICISLIVWFFLFVIGIIFMAIALFGTFVMFLFIDQLSIYTVDYIDEMVEKYETELLKKYVKGTVEHIENKLLIKPQVKKCDQILVDLHVLHLKSNFDNPVILLVHGAAGSSVSFVHMMDKLALEFDLYVIDLPGFGRSHVNCTYRQLAEAYRDSADFHVSVISEFIKVLGIEQVYLCGHSYGGYVCTRFTKMYPEKVTSLILLNPAGIFPTLGRLGMYWALFFKMSVPNVGLLFGRAGYFIITKFKGDSAEVLYWYYILGHPKGIGHLFVREKITFLALTAYWNSPVFDHFDDIKCPTFLIYGEEDTIMPVHQGMVIQKVHGHDLKVIKNSGHSPMNNVDNGQEVASGILKFSSLNYTKKVPLDKGIRGTILPHSYKGSFFVPKTIAYINRLYYDIGQHYNITIDIDAGHIETKQP